MFRHIGRFVVGVVAVLVVVAAVVVVRAAMVKPAAVTVPAATAAPLDEAGAVQRFIGAIRIPTESQAEQPPDQAAIGKLRDYLEQSFPKVHATMKREVLPDGAVLFTWAGRNAGAAPVVLMGHMDVVPAAAETLSQWKHAPYSGDVADGFIWGRGTMDDKVHVLSLLEAAETLIGRGFVPARTILFAFGDDEENEGKYGAKEIVALLKSRGVHPEFVIDEGGLIVQGVVPGVDKPVAIIGTAEKGVLDAVLTTHGAGGHSSAPPNHTAIGELSAALAKIEENPFHATLTPVTEQQYATLAPSLPFSKRLVLANLWLFKPLVIYSALGNPEQAGNFHTTIAEDLVSGGFKENALPTSARAVVNFRILPGDTTAGILERLRRTVDDPGVMIADETPNDIRDPSPISPTDSEGYKTLSTTIRQEFPDAIVAPNLLNAATDSTFYTVLTPNVYRFLAVEGDASVLAMIHGINERIPPEKYLKTVEFTVQLMENIR